MNPEDNNTTNETASQNKASQIAIHHQTNENTWCFTIKEFNELKYIASIMLTMMKSTIPAPSDHTLT